jgi:hypothetical protein
MGRQEVEKLILYLGHQSSSIFQRTSKVYVQEQLTLSLKTRNLEHSFPSVVLSCTSMIVMTFSTTSVKCQSQASVLESNQSRMLLQLSLEKEANGLVLTQRMLMDKMLKESQKNSRPKFRYTSQSQVFKMPWT